MRWFVLGFLLLSTPVLARELDFVRPGAVETSEILETPRLIPLPVPPKARSATKSKPAPRKKTSRSEPVQLQPVIAPDPVPSLERPIPLGSPVLNYPESARIAGQEGRAVIRALIDESGSVTEAQILRSSGFAELDRAAQNSVLNMRFKPALRGIRYEPSQVDIPINFSLS